MKHLLFVDDEPKVLDGLKRSLRPMREEWDMTFVASAAEALKVLEQAPMDVIVSDMRMPVIDGAQLLTEVRQRFPYVIRIVLSGHSRTYLKIVDGLNLPLYKSQHAAIA